jgi:Flp pilus assembly protein TadG
MHNRLGATAVEFALTAPLLFLFMFAAIELSRLSLIRNLAQDAAYDACRFAMVEGATTEEAEQKAKEVLAWVATNGAEIEVSELDDDADEISVDITIPMDQNCLLTSFLCNGKSINANITLARERYTGYYDASSE